MANIYWIRTRTGLYVGKWSRTDKDHMQYHLDRASFFMDKSSNVTNAWEVQWQDDIINNGLHDSHFIESTYTEDESIIKSRILESFNPIIAEYNKKINPEVPKTSADLFNFICNTWGVGELEALEALCILLAAKDNSDLLNLQVDFLTRKDLHNIDNFFSVQEMERRQEAVRKKWMPWIFFSFETEGPSLNDIDETIAKEMGLKGSVNVLKHPKVLQALLPLINKNTKKDIKRQLEDYIKHIKTSRGYDEDSSLVQYLRRIMRKIDHWRGNNRGELINMIKDAVTNKEWNKVFEDTYQLETNRENLQMIVDILKQWYQNTDCKNILNFSSRYDWKPQADLYYKKQLTKFIQSLCFSEAINYEYQDWKLFYATSREGFEKSDANLNKEGTSRWITSKDELYMSPGRFYPVWCRQKGIDEPDDTLCMKTYTKVLNLGTYIASNWTSGMYNEQVAYFLTQNDIAFNYTKITKGFINTITIEDMQYY